MSAEAVAELEKLPRSNSSDLLFRNSAGNAWSEIREWPKIREAARIEGVRLHDLRHNSESRIIPSGAAVLA